MKSMSESIRTQEGRLTQIRGELDRVLNEK
jgi:hypothetical protein